MTTLRVVQILLALFAVACFWYGSHRALDRDFTARAIIATTAAVVAIFCTQVFPLAWLSIAGTTTTARVTRLECVDGQKHYVHFNFMAGERNAGGVSADTFGARRCDSLHVGDEDTVVYIPGAPEIYQWGNLGAALNEYLFMCFASILGVPVMMYFIIRKRWRGMP